jgi:hypothetical protein
LVGRDDGLPTLSDLAGGRGGSVRAEAGRADLITAPSARTTPGHRSGLVDGELGWVERPVPQMGVADGKLSKSAAGESAQISWDLGKGTESPRGQGLLRG